MTSITARAMAAITLLVLLAAAVTQPLLHVTQFYFFEDDISLASVIVTLFENEDAALGALILTIGVIMPALKSLSILLLDFSRPLARKLFSVLNIFSSLDAFLIALTVFFVKISGLSTATTQQGMGFLIAFIVLSKVTEIALLRKYQV